MSDDQKSSGFKMEGSSENTAKPTSVTPHATKPGVVCPACGYSRKESDNTPAWQCPRCEVAYNKVNNFAGSTIVARKKEHASNGKLPIILFIIACVMALGIYAVMQRSVAMKRSAGTVASATTGDTSVQVILYTTSTCTYCKRARSFLEQQKVPFTEYQLDHDRAAQQDFMSKGGRGVPLIFVGEDRMDGWSEGHLRELLRKYNLN